jgi:serine/threonine-protein kinase
VTLRGPGVNKQHPSSLGKYRIVELIGEGAMGVVYKAHDPVIDRYVAAKVIRKSLLGTDFDEEIVRRFRNEAAAAGRLSHPNIVTVYEYGEDDQTAYIIMEYASGEALESYIARNGPRPHAEIVSLMTQLLEGLHFAHERGVVHRDIKPSNLIVAGGQLKITDFGIARLQASSLTRSGVAIGTPSYMAPEQYRGDGVDRRADVFSSGIVFFELCTGQQPFVGRTLDELGYKICHVEAPAVTSVNPELPPPVDAVAARAMAKDRDQRFETAIDFCRAMQHAFQSLSGSRTFLAVPSSPGAAPSAASSFAPNSISAADIDRVTRALAVHVGPIARVLVHRAAAGTRDPRDLCSKLEAQLGSVEERARFRRDVGMG